MGEFDDLNDVRLRLMDALGDQSKRYFHRMKLWFKMKITKEEFDLESRKQLTRDQIHLHNQFLLYLFQKCQGLAYSSCYKAIGSQSNIHGAPPSMDLEGASSPSERARKAKLSRKRSHSERLGFEPVEVFDYLPTLQSPTYQSTDEPPRSCAHELFLPDQAFLLGRLMLAAWERGLDGASESAADFMVCAVQHFLKTVLVAIFSQRSAFKINNKQFVHGMGTPIPNPWLRNTAHISAAEAPTEVVEVLEDKCTEGDEHDSIHAARVRSTQMQLEEQMILEAACSGQGNLCASPAPLSSWDLLDALQTHKSAVMSQTVYAINVERILTKLIHASWDDEEAAKARKSGCPS